MGRPGSRRLEASPASDETTSGGGGRPYLGSAWKRQGQASDAKRGTPADTPKEEKTHLDGRRALCGQHYTMRAPLPCPDESADTDSNVASASLMTDLGGVGRDRAAHGEARGDGPDHERKDTWEKAEAEEAVFA